MARLLLAIVSLFICRQGFTQVIAFEGTCFPEECVPSWSRLGTLDVDRWLDEGWFYQFADLGAWAPPPFGENDAYQRSLAPFAATPNFFIEWRVLTNVPISDLEGTPTVVSAAGDSTALYHVTITNGRLRFYRDNFKVIFYYDYEPDLPHTFRVEIHNTNEYCLFLDGICIQSGTSVAPYPVEGAVLLWATRYYLTDNTTKWDYLRYGKLPAENSGDFDSNGAVDTSDLYFFVDCLLGPAGAWPGCKWADMNSDGSADGADVQAFVQALTNS